MNDFNVWMAEVDNLVETEFNISVHDLPDMRFRDNFDDGVTPSEFVEEEVMIHIEEMMGMSAFF